MTETTTIIREELNHEDLHHVLGVIAGRAAVDADFRAMALSDGHAAITEACGRSLPADISVRFVEPYKNAVRFIMLPDPLEERTLFLEEDLGCELSDNTTCMDTCVVSCMVSVGI
jgi:hypothetical protein